MIQSARGASYFLIPLVPLLVGELLPDVAPLVPQSFIAVCDPPVAPVLVPGLVDEPLALGLPEVEPVLLPLELVEPDGIFVAVELPGPQSVRLLFIAPLVPLLVLGLVLVAPPLLLVCASAAVPSESARIDAAVRTRRFIGDPPVQARRLLGRCLKNHRLRHHVPVSPQSRAMLDSAPPAPKEKGPHRNAAQVQGGKARRTCNALRRTGLAPQEKNRPEFLNKWLTW